MKQVVRKTILATMVAALLVMMPSGGVLPSTGITAKAQETYMGYDYSAHPMNKVDHTGWTAITDINQLKKLPAGQYYLDFPDGVCNCGEIVKQMDVTGDVTIDLNGNAWLAHGYLDVAQGGHLTICDSGYNKRSHNFRTIKDDRGKEFWDYQPDGEITVKGGVMTGLAISYNKDQKVTIYGGNIIGNIGDTRIFMNGTCELEIEGGNFLAKARICVSDEAVVSVKNASFLYDAEVQLLSLKPAEVKNCEVKNTGGLKIKYETNIDNCLFENNSAGIIPWGSTEYAKVTVNNSQFIGNNNAVYGEKATVTLNDVKISDSDVAAIRLNGNLSMNRCTVTDNQGGITVNWGAIEINSSRIADNVGGVHDNGTGITITDTTIENIQGKGVMLGHGELTYQPGTCKYLTITGSTIANCTDSGIYASHTDEGTIKDCVVKDNEKTGICVVGGIAATADGLVEDAGSGVTISGCTITGNREGGIDSSVINFTLTDSKITDNSSTTKRVGGVACGTYKGSTKTIIRNCEILRNSSQSTVGGVGVNAGAFDDGAQVLIEDCRINENISKGEAGGGGIYVSSGHVTVKDCEVNRNVAKSAGSMKGGAIGTWSGTIVLDGTTVTGNTVESSGESGGAIWMNSNYEGAVYLDGTRKPCVITGNTVTTTSTFPNIAGGIYDSEKHQLHMAGEIIVTDNTVNRNGSEEDCNVLIATNLPGIYVDTEDDEKAPLSGSSVIGVTRPNDKNLTCKSEKYMTVTAGDHEDYQQYFTSDSGLTIKRRDESAGIRVIMERDHDWGETCVSNGDGTHSGSCKVCGKKNITEDCHGGKANCTDKAICADCGAEYGDIDPDGHDWGEWEETEDGLRRICKRNKEHIEEKENENPKTYMISARAETKRTGAVTIYVNGELGTEAKKGDTITLETKPWTGYEFIEWKVVSGDVTIGEDNTFVMPAADVELVAVFEPKRHTITALPETPGTGTVTAQVDGEEVSKVKTGNKVTLTAQPAEGYHFVEWKVVSGDVEVYEGGELYMPDTDVEVRAVFEPDLYTVKTYAEVIRSGSLYAYVDGEMVGQAKAGEKVTLKALPRDGYELGELLVKKGDVTVDENGCFVMPQGDVEISAVFVPSTFRITARPEVADTGIVECYVDDKLTTQAKTGDFVKLKATPAEGYRFVKWLYDTNAIHVSESDQFIMPPFATEVRALFEPIPETLYTITVEVEGEGSASVSKDKAEKGETIAIVTETKLSPVIITIAVTDANGKEIERTKNETFIMPESDVKVKVTFATPGRNDAICIFVPTNDPNVNWNNAKERIRIMNILAKIALADDGDTVTFDMQGQEILPYTILSAIRGKDVNLELKMGEQITWTINGKTVTKAPLKGVNMGVALHTNEIPAELVSENDLAVQISLAHKGDYGFKAKLTLDMTGNDGKRMTLYCYNEGAQKLETFGTSVITKGKVSFTFTRASQYLFAPVDGFHPNDPITW